MRSGEAFPPAHWTDLEMAAELVRSALAYHEIAYVMPSQDLDTFNRAEQLLADCQDMRDELTRRGHVVPGWFA